MREKRWLLWAAAASLWLAQVYLGWRMVERASPTYDEPVHLAAGYSYLATGRYTLNIHDHPPLAEMWAALPLLPLKPLTFFQHEDWINRRPYHYADLFLHHNSVPAERLLNRARLFSLVTWSLVLSSVLFLWGMRLGGPVAGLLTLFLAATTPPLFSNLALVTTDAAPAVFFFLCFFILSRSSAGNSGARSPWPWVGSGVCMGLALASKFSMILLPALAAAGLVAEKFLWEAQSFKSSLPRMAGRLALGLGCAAAVLLVVYRFGQVHLYFQGLADTFGRLQSGRSSFLMGEHSVTGFWAYFPVAFALKTPLPHLALGLLGLGWVAWEKRWREFFWVLFPMAAYFAAAVPSKVQIGLRHLLPVYPFFLLLAGWAAARLCEIEAGRLARGFGRLAVGLLVVWANRGVKAADPHYLAYFNELAGGSARGYRYLVDSNLDWGQGLKELSRILKSYGNPTVYLSYFGVGDPHAYGIRYVPFAMVTNLEGRRTGQSGLWEQSRPAVPQHVAGDPADVGEKSRLWVAVSATNLQCVYFADKGLFDWLKGATPIAVAGHSIFLYEFAADPDAVIRLAELLRRSGSIGEAARLLLQFKETPAASRKKSHVETPRKP